MSEHVFTANLRGPGGIFSHRNFTPFLTVLPLTIASTHAKPPVVKHPHTVASPRLCSRCIDVPPPTGIFFSFFYRALFTRQTFYDLEMFLQITTVLHYERLSQLQKWVSTSFIRRVLSEEFVIWFWRLGWHKEYKNIHPLHAKEKRITFSFPPLPGVGTGFKVKKKLKIKQWE